MWFQEALGIVLNIFSERKQTRLTSKKMYESCTAQDLEVSAVFTVNLTID